MKDYLRKLAHELGLEAELEAALAELDRRHDYEMLIATSHEEEAFDEPQEAGTDVTSTTPLVRFGEA